MLSETSGDFADVPEHPEIAPAASNANTVTNALSVFMFLLRGIPTEFRWSVQGILPRLSLATFVRAMAIDVGSLFHGLSGSSSILSPGFFASSDRVRAFLFLFRPHVFLLLRSEAYA